jgi:uncharacterized lipoprotein YddW (UPF0748 family)
LDIKKIIRTILLSVVILFGCSSVKIENSEKVNQDLPKVEREFRGAWIATVANINWPSKKGLSSDEQKKEAVNILDKLSACNLNAIIFQARPQCDALYKSELEPWSYFLTGMQGQAPEPFYDPLEFWIEEAHKRGMELHVWLNPYRAHHINGGEVSEHSIVKKHPDWVVNLKSGYWWLDPSKKEVQDHSLNVVLDITKRYDVDGIHFDDYFYPYPSYNDDIDFPDEKSWNNYLAAGGKLSRSDWRRHNINDFIERVYNGIKKIKPYVKFGLSPFGIWRPGNPASIEGFDQYEKIFADAKLWINKGWVDYWSPQIYWKISTVKQSFPVILNWWKNENLKGKHYWPGINIVRDNTELNTQEAINQIMIIRGMLPDSPGNICWSAKPILEFKELFDALINGPYKRKALIPTTDWFNNSKPPAPKVNISVTDESVNLSWSLEKMENVFCWVVYFKYDGRWDYKIFNKEIKSYEVPLISEIKFFNSDGNEVNRKYKLTEIAVSSVDRISNESVPTILKIN